MQAENSSNIAIVLEPVAPTVELGVEEPQAAITVAQIAATIGCPARRVARPGLQTRFGIYLA
jgi:hypothetical protein